MKLSISNIAWTLENDENVYGMMKQYGFEGLEIAPTRIFPEKPYDKNDEAKQWAEDIYNGYGLSVSSMQSIWYGVQEKIFGTEEERKILLEYTKKAIDFAVSIKCKNLVFGCPRNRNIPEGVNDDVAVSFFRELGDYAYSVGTVIGMEANPTIYNTNYINTTESALELIDRVNSKGFKLNLDIGTMIQNQEDLEVLKNNVSKINHVHISEPGLKPIEERGLHKELYKILEAEGYQGYVSIEMGKVDDIDVVEQKMSYLRSVFA
jgi:sugar phosphate isomerase/epimerase